LGDITSLKVREVTRDRFAKLGNKSETFDQIINRLIDESRQHRKRTRQGS